MGCPRRNTALSALCPAYFCCNKGLAYTNSDVMTTKTDVCSGSMAKKWDSITTYVSDLITFLWYIYYAPQEIKKMTVQIRLLKSLMIPALMQVLVKQKYEYVYHRRPWKIDITMLSSI